MVNIPLSLGFQHVSTIQGGLGFRNHPPVAPYWVTPALLWRLPGQLGAPQPETWRLYNNDLQPFC